VCCWFGAALLWDTAPFAGLLECVSQYIINQNAFAQRLTTKHQRNKFCCHSTTPSLLKSAANRSLTSAALQAWNLSERLSGAKAVAPFSYHHAGPVLSRFDRFFLIGPRATPTNQHKFALCIEADCEYFRRGAQCFSRGFEIPKRFLNYSNGLSKQFKLALLTPSKYTKTLFYNHLSIQIKQLRSLKMSL